MNPKLRIQHVTFIAALFFGSCASAQTGELQSISGCRLIDQPGSYVLTRNITARQQDLRSIGPSCILIVADFVTLDLRGYTLTGPGSGFGIYSTANSVGNFPSATVVRNGSIRNFDRGIAFEGYGHAAEDVRLMNNSGAGLTFDGAGSSAERVHTLFNNNGILCFGVFGHSVRHSEVILNNTDGISFNACPGSSAIGNTVFGNGGGGIVAKCPSVVLQNVATQNVGGDIVVDSAGACTLSDNSPAP
jgi:hypothetical protein